MVPAPGQKAASEMDESKEAGDDFGPGLYLHYPFCVQRCSYCDFFSQVAPSGDREGFVEWLLNEITLAASIPEFQNVVFRTIFFGGGTPSLLSGGSMRRLMQRLRACFRLEQAGEITVECNPESLTPDLMRGFRAEGVNRISLGVQSLDDAELRLLDRAHDAGQVGARMVQLRQAGFDNVSFDLIYGLPGSTGASWERTLLRALELAPEHVSAYLLTLEPHVPMAATAGALPGDDAAREQYEILRRRTEEAGLLQYEISSFARPGLECRHNQNYWVRGDYLGLGPAAHSHHAGQRWANPPSMDAYASAIRQGRLPRILLEQVDDIGVAQERIFLGLRRTAGVVADALLAAAGPAHAEALSAKIEGLIQAGVLDRRGERLRLRSEAYFISNAVFIELMAALPARVA
jgi:oxygen-independent coproporphyrinogen III oxidase